MTQQDPASGEQGAGSQLTAVASEPTASSVPPLPAQGSVCLHYFRTTRPSANSMTQAISLVGHSRGLIWGFHTELHIQFLFCFV